VTSVRIRGEILAIALKNNQNKMKTRLFTRDDATTHDPDEVRLLDYRREHDIHPDQIHDYPSFNINFSDGSVRLFRCKGKIYLEEYSYGVYEDLYEIDHEEASALLKERTFRFLMDA
jgi:hypothetical protein